MLCDDLGGEMGKGREAKEGSDIYVCVCVYVYKIIADLHCSTA